jgi:potassium-dependent mechanosensitive channel
MNAHTGLRVFLSIVVIALAGVFCASPLSGQTPKPIDPAPPKATAPASSKPDQVAEIAGQATAVSNLLRALSAKLAPSPEIQRIRDALPATSRQIDGKFLETVEALEKGPTLESLQAHQQSWQQLQLQTSAWLKVLTARAVALKEATAQLADLEQTWLKTLAAAQVSKAPQPLLDQVQEVLATIRSDQKPLEEQSASVLDLQGLVASELDRCGAVLARISKAQEAVVGGIFKRDGMTVWSPELWSHARDRLPASTRQAAVAFENEISSYVRDPSTGMLLHSLLLAGLAALFGGMRRRLRRWQAGDEEGAVVTGLDRPYAAALLAIMFFASGPVSTAPPTVKVLFEVLAIAPMIRLIKPVIDPLVIPGLYVLWALFALDTVRQTIAGGPLAGGPVILLLESLAGITVLGWSLLFGRLGLTDGKGGRSGQRRTLRLIAILLLLVLAVGAIAGATGYLRLSRIIVSEVLAGAVTALALLAFVRIANGAAAFALRAWPLRSLNTVAHHRGLLERRAHTILIWIAVITWAGRLLDYVGLWQPTLAMGSALLNTKLERGSLSISVVDIIAFFLTVWVAYLLSAFIRFVLREDVYSRIGIQRGASLAVSSLLNYVILALGFVVALGIIGVDFSKVTVLAGAFGVGIGFGLQGVVNDFVAGLILLFERPIHVGDTVEIGNLTGEMRRIGIRSSLVRTSSGADIIVPNSDLTRNQVTNWTLGDSLRRIDLDVGFNYGAEPREVISLLERTAANHPDILQKPRPQGLFVGYGDSAINFQLRAWTDRSEDWPAIKSDLASAVYDAVRETAGMSFPFPQRDVHIVGSPNEEPGTPLVDGWNEPGKV